MADDPPKAFQPDRIIALLADAEVEFVLIGGLAGNLHGSARATFDIDIFYKHDPANLERLAQVLLSINARLSGVPADLPFTPDAETLRRGSNYTFETDLGRLDILAEPSGAAPFAQVLADSAGFQLGDHVVRAASLDHLIRMKRAAGRPKDKDDIAEFARLDRKRRSQ